jgi:hypothetical protein
MPHFISWPLHWMWDHPYQTAFYIVAILISIFARDIRTFFSIPPQKLNIWLLKSRLTNAKSTLVGLQNCHGNPYRLLIFVAASFSSAAVFFIAATVMAFLRPFTPPPGGVMPILMIFTIYLFSGIILWFTAAFLTQLSNYETETKKLEQRIMKLIDRLAAKGIDSAALLKSVEETQRAK